MAPNQELMNLVTDDEPELVFAVVAPVGTDLDEFEKRFGNVVHQFKYQVRTIKLSNVARRLNTSDLNVAVDESDDFKRISSLMTLGTEVRRRAGRGDVLALHAISEIARTRESELGKAFRPKPNKRTVHLLRNVKHPHEVEALRRVYGPGFFLIGVNASPELRLGTLTQWQGMTPQQAEELFSRDENEDDPLGQKTRDTFALSDVFVSAEDYDELARFLDLVFDEPFSTPTSDEYAMFLAYAASLRSAQMARQVGAVVVSAAGEVIATGVNEVPKAGGGLYWPSDTDGRDHKQGGDSNDRAIEEIIGKLLDATDVKEAEAREALAVRFRATPVGDLTEFGRVVHAEMEALLACARVGVSPRGGTLFCTTFPCHNCAKHIIAAGIKKVVYVEPYPKSRAVEHHKDAISLTAAPDRVHFVPFVGVAARRYFDLFSMRLSAGMPMVRKKAGGPRDWQRPTAKPRLRMSPYGYMDREQLVVELLDKVITAIEKTDEPETPTSPAREK